MKAHDRPLTQFLEGVKQFIIPIFQRTYSWELPQCQQLWNDILRVGATSDEQSHFIGSAVYILDENASATVPRWLVIDGQQRLTTIILLLCALRKRLEAVGEVDDLMPEFLTDTYLINRHRKGDERYKLLLTKGDALTVKHLLDGKDLADMSESDISHRVAENFRFFEEQLAKADLATVHTGLKRLVIVDVSLKQGQDDPQMIFESMNSTGKALTQADLIRNKVLMGLDHDRQTQCYEDYWRPMEELFGAENYTAEFDAFIRYYLVIKTKNHRLRRKEVYDEFKAYARPLEVEDLLRELKRYAEYFCTLAFSTASSPLVAALKDMRELKADVTYPFFMQTFDAHSRGCLTDSDLLEIVRLVESYIWRRAACEIPTNSLRQTFATIGARIDESDYLNSFKFELLSLRSYRHFPSDEEFKKDLKSRNLYTFNRRSYWLRRLENFGRREAVSVAEYTVEHIMPQNTNLGAKWQNDLGENWAEVQERYLHTLGNLTLTAYNSSMSDKPFTDKRDAEKGFRYSPLILNEGLQELQKWDERAIRDRANRLANRACDVWPMVEVAPEVMQKYQEKAAEAQRYSINDHAHLSSGITRELFDAYRTELLALDECVREEFLKLYIAFKAETNFADIIPQAERLRVSLNIDFKDIIDERSICNDVRGRGRWGNGDVEFFLTSLEDVPYATGLARQALEKQM